MIKVIFEFEHIDILTREGSRYISVDVINTKTNLASKTLISADIIQNLSPPQRKSLFESLEIALEDCINNVNK